MLLLYVAYKFFEFFLPWLASIALHYLIWFFSSSWTAEKAAGVEDNAIGKDPAYITYIAFLKYKHTFPSSTRIISDFRPSIHDIAYLPWFHFFPHSTGLISCIFGALLRNVVSQIFQPLRAVWYWLTYSPLCPAVLFEDFIFNIMF